VGTNPEVDSPAAETPEVEGSAVGNSAIENSAEKILAVAAAFPVDQTPAQASAAVVAETAAGQTRPVHPVVVAAEQTRHVDQSGPGRGVAVVSYLSSKIRRTKSE
jgi:hypothetical protein